MGRFSSYVKERLYDLGLDERALAEISMFLQGVTAKARYGVLRPRRGAPQHEYLHLGCGFDSFPGFVNVDRVGTPATDLVVDIRKTLPFQSTSMRGIFHQHAFEHIDHPRGARTLLRESARVLVHGGLLRIGVPDLAKYVDAYVRFDRQFAQTAGIENVEYAAQILNYVFAHGHRFIYDFDALKSELSRAGFQDVRRAGFRDSADPMLNQDKDHPSRLVDTIFVEARRS